MASNNSSISASSNAPQKNEHIVVDNSEVAHTDTKGVTEMRASGESRLENLSIPSKLADNPNRQPEASTNDSVKVLHARPLTSPCKPLIKTEDEVKAAEKAVAVAETKSSVMQDAMNNDIILMSETGVDYSSKPSKSEDVHLDEHNQSMQACAPTEQQQESPALGYGSQQVSQLSGTVIQRSPMALNQPMIPIQPRYLRREEYLAAVMTSTPADFTNPPNSTTQDAFTYGRYEHLLGYVNALDDAGQISTAQEVIILATAQCFRPLGLLADVDQSFELTAGILKYCHSFARGQLLHFLQTMIERAPAAFIPRGEAFIPILDGLGKVLASYCEMLVLVAQAMMENCDNVDVIMERWRVERENTVLTMGILQWFARQPAHWASMNGSKILVMALYDLVTEPSVDREIHGMVMDFIALNGEFLPSVDMYIPQNVILDSILSTLEYGAGRKISSLQYPEYMSMTQMVASDAEVMLSGCLTIVYHYASVIPRTNLVLSRFVDIVVELIGDESMIDYRWIVCCTTKRLFERFPDEFDVCDEFINKLGKLLNDEVCRDCVLCMLRIIQERCGNDEEGKTN